MQPNASVIFLDFDGVLHPVGTPARGPGVFAHKAFLEGTLQSLGLENLEIVITSTWRLAIPLRNPKKLFSPDVAARIIGKTPDALEPGDFPRYDEIQEWLEMNGVRKKNGSLLTDDPERFPPGIPNVVFTDSSVGFDQRAAEMLVQLVRGGR